MRPVRLAATALVLGLSQPLLAAPVAMTALGQVPYSGFTDALFVHDNIVYMMSSAGGFNGLTTLYILDVSDPASAVELSRRDLPGRTPDMHGIYYSNGLLYAGYKTDGGGGVGGFEILDVTDPTQPVLVGTAVIATGVHDLRYADGFVYVMPDSFGDVDVIAVDVRDPANPVIVGSFGIGPGNSYCHDMSIHDGIGYASMWGDGLYLLDLSDPTRTPSMPVLKRSPTGRATHSAWPNADLTEVLICHERRNTDGGTDIGLDIYNVEQEPFTLTSHYESHETIAQEEAIIHDVMVAGKFAYISYYGEGIRILDISNPSAPVEVGSYVTAANPCTGYCSQIAQWVEDGRVYGLDEDNGLWIFSFDLPHEAPITIWAVKSGGGRDVAMSWNHTGESQYTVRRGTDKRTIGPVHRDVDARVTYGDGGAVLESSGSRLWYYKINGPWR